jgi:hypothetical protein
MLRPAMFYLLTTLIIKYLTAFLGGQYILEVLVSGHLVLLYQLQIVKALQPQ